MNEHQLPTSCIVHLAVSANFKGVTSNKLCNGLTGSCFESPNDTIHVTVIGHFRTTVTTDKNNINGTTRQTKKRY